MNLAVGVKAKASHVFINKVAPWMPLGAQAIYGGTFIAQALVAAQKTITLDISPQGIHCTFLLGGKAHPHLEYHVDVLSDHPENTIRHIRAYQDNRCLFTATVRYGSVTHATVPRPLQAANSSIRLSKNQQFWYGGLSETCPFMCSEVVILQDGQSDATVMAYQWMKLSKSLPASSQQIHHLAALAYMSDNYLLPTASRLMNIYWARDPEYQKYGQIAAQSKNAKDSIGLMLTLNHQIRFHNARDLNADQLLLAEMKILWVGDGRALVGMDVFDVNGRLIATVHQEVCFYPSHVVSTTIDHHFQGLFRLEQQVSKL